MANKTLGALGVAAAASGSAKVSFHIDNVRLEQPIVFKDEGHLGRMRGMLERPGDAPWRRPAPGAPPVDGLARRSLGVYGVC